MLLYKNNDKEQKMIWVFVSTSCGQQLYLLQINIGRFFLQASHQSSIDLLNSAIIIHNNGTHKQMVESGSKQIDIYTICSGYISTVNELDVKMLRSHNNCKGL